MFGNSRTGRKEAKPVSPVRTKDPDREYPESSEANTLPKTVTDVQAEINISWDFMTSAEFNPVPHALSLLDESSLGRDFVKFCETYSKLEKAMDVIVNDYHQAFNTSIQTFSSVVENITDSQRRVHDSRKKLEDSKEWLQCKRFDLMHLWLKSIQYKEIARILDAIEDMQTTPDRLEALIQGKYYLTAVRLLLSAMRTLAEGECADIGALEAVKQKLQEIRESIHETLIEELHNHVYLKSAFSLYRLDAVSQKHVVTGHALPGHAGHQPPRFEGYSKGRGPSQAKTAELLDKKAKFAAETETEEITEDLETNPESDSFHYILCLMEALYLLGRLPEAMQLVKDRLPVELYYVVERTVQEADQEYSTPAGAGQDGGKRTATGSTDPNFLGTDARTSDIRTLLKFLNDLFCKFESIIQAHSFVQGTIQSVRRRHPEFQPDGLYTLRDVWYNAQNELKAMLYEYVSNAEKKTSDPNAVASLNDILKDKRRAKIRADNQSLFHVIGADSTDMVSVYKAINSDAEAILGEDVAQARQIDAQEVANQEEGTSMGIIDAYASNAVVTGHRLLIDADPYNVLIVFEPTSGFVRRMEELLKVKFGNLKIFLDEFIISVFLPQMENRVLHFFQTYVNGIDAFNTDFAVELSSYPLTKSAMALTSLIQGICRAMPKIPIHQGEAIRMIETVLRSYYEKCLSRFNALTSSNQPGADGGYSSIISASWVRNADVSELLARSELAQRENTKQGRDTSEMCHQQETFIELKLKKDRSFHRSELLLEQRTLQAIASLHHSMEWFHDHTCDFLAVTPNEPQASRYVSGSKATKWSRESLNEYFQLSSDSLPDLPVEFDENLVIPLSAEMTKTFQGILANFQRLADLCLFVLRVEVRCHSMYFLDLALREGSYHLDDEAQEPDPYIGLLNVDLSTIEEAMGAVLKPRRTRFIFDGLAYLIGGVLCSNMKHLKRVNGFGVGKLVRNVQSLQQNLTNITSVHFKNLDRAREYFELLNLNSDGLFDHLQRNAGRFNFDEYKVVLDILFKDAADDWKRKQYEDAVQKLKDWFVKH
ncbi:hypothetical protein HKX48_006633 [Thoreauomyces humboldtii]|nr:hypothetical protein HKX48_006633 [Thoreauomyces humboldtii]